MLNWSAVRGSNTDFNNNARGIQGGKGFATDVRGVDRTALVFNHGPVLGISDSLDAHPGVGGDGARADRSGSARATEQAGRSVFDDEVRRVPWRREVDQEPHGPPCSPDNPTVCGGSDRRASSLRREADRSGRDGSRSADRVGDARRQGHAHFLDNVGTFNPANPIEIRGAAAVAGQSTQGFAAFGGAGFNSPSLLGLSLSAPYFHDGSAQTLEDVAKRHQLGGGKTIEQTLSAQELVGCAPVRGEHR